MKIQVIGAGGVASYLLPQLKRLFKEDLYVVLQDQDILETRNLDRQVFHPDFVGMNKADALIQTTEVRGEAIPKWFTPGQNFSPDIDLVICVADNNACREAVLAQCDIEEIPVIIGGNESFDSHAFLYGPAWKDTALDPRTRYPEIITDESFNPIRCTDVTVMEAAPQTSFANARASDHILHILYSWFMTEGAHFEGTNDVSMYSFIDIYTTQYSIRTKTKKTILEVK